MSPPTAAVAAVRRGGFTLVELLVVIGIIALLIGILLPALNKARAAGQEAVCLSNMHQLGLGFTMYCDQNHGLVPQKGPDGSNDSDNAFAPSGGVTGVDDPSLWFNAVASSMGRKSYYQMLLDDQAGNAPAPTSAGGRSSVFVCPSAVGAGGNPGASPPDYTTADGQYFLLCGVDSFTPTHPLTPIGSPVGPSFKFNMSYVANGSLTNTFANTQSFSTVHLSKLRPGSEVVIIEEKLVNPVEYAAVNVQRYVNAFNAANGSAYWSGIITQQGFQQNIGQPKGNWKRFAARHNGGGNLLFADGHAAYFKWSDAQYPLSAGPFQIKSGTTGSDFNQPGKMIWSIAGPIQ